jgi:hypothetical protein
MRTILVSVLGVAVAAGAASADRLPAFPYEQVPVTIQSLHSGKCLDIRGAAGDGAILQQYPCGEQENQTFHLLWTGGDRYQLRPGHRGNVRLVVAGGDGAVAHLGNGETTAELFRFTPNTDGTFAIVSNQSGKCLDVPGWSLQDGMEIQQWWCSGGTNQRWRIIPRARPLHIVAKHSGRCLDVVGAAMGWGATMQQYDCLGAQQDNQDWIAESSGGFWRFRAQHSNMCLTANGYSTGLIQWPCQELEFQRFAVTNDADGHFELRNRATGTCVQVAGGSTANQTLVHLGACTAGDHQRFRTQRNVRRHLLVIQPATSYGADRYTATTAEIEHHVAAANAVYKPHGIEVVFDVGFDTLNVDSDALHAAGDLSQSNTYMPCAWSGWFQLYATPSGCGDHYRSLYPDRIIVMIGPGANAGYSSGDSPFVFLRPSITPNTCGTGVSSSIFAHELGHYLGLGHAMNGYPNQLAAGDAYVAAGSSTAAFEADNLDDTLPDVYLDNSCLAPEDPVAYQWIQLRQGWIIWVGIPVMTDNIMSYYFNVEPKMTAQQAAIARATATIRGL